MEQIGSILRRLRTERGFTQTEVAAAISVTSQAVSKWENGSGIPDVSQLVPLADFFGVTVDCILGRRDNAAEEEIQAFLKRNNDVVYHARKLRDEKNIPMKEAYYILLEDVRNMLRKYPDEYRLMIHACWVLYFAPKESGFDGTPEEYELYGELVDLAERILAECSVSKLRNDAVWLLSVTYPYLNRFDKVKALAEQAPDINGCRQSLMCYAAEHGTEERRRYQEAYLNYSIANVHYNLWGWYIQNTCPPEERLALADMEWRIYHAYHDHNDFDGWRACTLFENRLYAARAYLAMNDTSAAEDAIQAGLNLLASVIADESPSCTSTAMTRLGDKLTWSRNDNYPDWVRDMAKKFTKDTGVDITDRLEAVLTTA